MKCSAYLVKTIWDRDNKLEAKLTSDMNEMRAQGWHVLAVNPTFILYDDPEIAVLVTYGKPES